MQVSSLCFPSPYRLLQISKIISLKNLEKLNHSCEPGFESMSPACDVNSSSSNLCKQELYFCHIHNINLQKYYFSAHMRFKALAPEKVGHNKNAKLPMAKILQYPELRVNPFRDRICKVFSSSNDGDCTFEDFLDMMSVFSDNAPKAVKAEHAFRIFGKEHIFCCNRYPLSCLPPILYYN